MIRKRPTAVTVLAVMNLAFGGMGLLSFLCLGAGVACLALAFAYLPPPTGGAPDPTAMLKELYGSVPGFVPYMATVLTLGGIMAGVLFASGVGLMKMRPWARWAAIVYGLYALLESVGNTIYVIFFLSPALAAVQQQMDPNNPMAGNTILNAILVVFGQLFQIAYAVALLAVMFAPSVRAAFARASAPEGLEDVLPAEDFQAPLYPRKEWQE